MSGHSGRASHGLPNSASLISPISRSDTDSLEPLGSIKCIGRCFGARSFLCTCISDAREGDPSSATSLQAFSCPRLASAEFVAAQPIQCVPPPRAYRTRQCVFSPLIPETIVLSSSLRTTTPFLFEPFYSVSTQTCTPSRISAGLYTEAVERPREDVAEEGLGCSFRFTFTDDRGKSVGARKSDGSLVDRGRFSELFQHGFKPLGG
ncbi:hypothetical protein N7540_011209 [Penicillium herquei]|nr:hypothetical protein N7540_011209 [Penicillium herquei]